VRLGAALCYPAESLIPSRISTWIGVRLHVPVCLSFVRRKARRTLIRQSRHRQVSRGSHGANDGEMRWLIRATGPCAWPSMAMA
jgi:hypothetical protein